LAYLLITSGQGVKFLVHVTSPKGWPPAPFQFNLVENWNATNDFICYGRKGELATNSREQQEAVTLSLQLLQNCMMLISTILVERTIEDEDLWGRLSAEDFRAMTPLFHRTSILMAGFPLIWRGLRF
jgi:hypothetical protein